MSNLGAYELYSPMNQIRGHIPPIDMPQMKLKKYVCIPLMRKALITADTDLLKSVPVEILLNFGNYFRTLQLGF